MSAQDHTTLDLPNTVRLELSSDLQSYCYIINASNGTFAVLIEGFYSNSKYKENMVNGTSITMITCRRVHVVSCI